MESGGLPTCVALDLETTGLDLEQDTIIEVGAVKFRGTEVLDTFQSLVNPYRDLSPFIKKLTGIAQADVDRAPPFAAVAGELGEFIFSHPVVGHNIAFDLGFLTKHGLQLTNDSFDTWDLASILLPFNQDYSLANLVKGLTIDHDQPHRALSDAEATRQVFISLLDKIASLDPATTASIGRLGGRAGWPIARFFQLDPREQGSPSSALPTGLDLQGLTERLGRPGRLPRPEAPLRPLDEDQLASLFAPEGAFARRFPGFERRPQQMEMVRAVASAFNREQHLVVEAGTGVGKSIGYLLPALVYAVQNSLRVVISTNTINLQEQLLQKDIPALLDLLNEEGIIPADTAKAVPLKGRANYLCLRRWSMLARAEGLSADEARLLGKSLVWLGETQQGDRAEINLSGRDAFTWSRISAAERSYCPGMRGEGPCFLRAARDRAEGAHIIVVNHALLMADLAMGGALLPDHQFLIIDEAHHLEEEATRQLGFQISERALDEVLEALTRNLREIRVVMMTTSLSNLQRQRAEGAIGEMEAVWAGRARERWDNLWDLAGKFMSQQNSEGQDRSQLALARSTRVQPGWSDIEIAWENVDIMLQDGINRMESLLRALDPARQESSNGSPNWEGMNAGAGELTSWSDHINLIKDQLKTLLAGPGLDGRIDWMTMVEEGQGSGPRRSHLLFQSAPLNVAKDLAVGLFEQKTSVIMTSATLSTQGSFDYLRDRVGPSVGPELLVGSPFDYTRSAQLLLPDDMPMPDSWEYQGALERFLIELGLALDGHTMVLFISYAALRGAARGIRGTLESEGIGVLAQGNDGSPARIIRNFTQDPRGMILGTSSFWEGVDLSGGLLKALVIARLPFRVPTDPIFAARSAQYGDPFKDYAVPQAILRLRQGIGRLIRNSDDRGSIIVLDRRLTTRSYSKAFLDSLPPCTIKRVPLDTITGHTSRWLEDKEVRGGGI